MAPRALPLRSPRLDSTAWLPLWLYSMSTQATNRLDRFYATALGCSPGDLRAGGAAVVEGDLDSIWFAKGAPLMLYGLVTPEGAAIVARPGLGAAVERAVRGSCAAAESMTGAVRESMRALAVAGTWFEGVRLYCEPDSFVDLSCGSAVEVPAGCVPGVAADHEWGGAVFGLTIDGRVVSRAAVKPLSDAVWDLSVETLTQYRGRGYAKSVVSAAVKHILARGVLAGWGCDRTNAASLRLARSVGFRQYAFDLGLMAAGCELPVAPSAIS
jgi:GNAT superfamily N-acetyltransferase